MGQATRGALERAARQLGVTSTTLRQYGWKTASPARVKAAVVDARWAPEVSRADASYAAACYRAGRLLRRAPGGDGGQVRDP